MLTKESSWAQSLQEQPGHLSGLQCWHCTDGPAHAHFVPVLCGWEGMCEAGGRKGMEVKYDIVGGLHTRSEEFGFLLHIGNREPLNIVE